MKLAIVALVILWLPGKGISQTNNWQEADRVAISIPALQSNSTTDIAAYINVHFNTEDEKVRAAYTWVACNIHYNADSIRPVVFEEERDQKIASALRRRKGVCENYASIFNDICIKCGLRSLMIEGYTRQNGSIDKSPHAWCTVFTGHRWLLYDPTWDEGLAHRSSFTNNISYDYFQVSPEIFIDTHMPFDPMFQLLNYPLTYKDFNNPNTASNHDRSFFNYEDSLGLYLSSDPLKKYSSAVLRIQKNGPSNTMVTNKLNQLKMNVEIIYQDRDTTLYNLAVADYNKALAKYNTFINYRNNGFMPVKSGSELQELFEDAGKNIASANLTLTDLYQSKAGLTLNTDDLQKVLDDLSAHLKQQQNFLKDYYSSAKSR